MKTGKMKKIGKINRQVSHKTDVAKHWSCNKRNARTEQFREILILVNSKNECHCKFFSREGCLRKPEIIEALKYSNPSIYVAIGYKKLTT